MWKLYKYGFLRMMRSKEVIFWAAIFPILLGTFLFLMIGGVSDIGFTPIPVGVVGEANLAEVLESTGMMEVSVLEYAEAREKLESGDITGFFHVGDEGVQLVVANIGVNQNILQTVGSQILQRLNAMESIAAVDPGALEGITWESGVTSSSAAGDTNIGDVVTFIMLLVVAMTCVMSYTLGTVISGSLQPKLSETAVRRVTTPTKKIKLIFCEFWAAMTVQVFIMLGSLAYFIFVLGVDFGDRMPLLLLAAVIGSMTSISMGIMLFTILPGTAKVRDAIASGISVAMMFAAGLMVLDIRLLIRDHAPIIDRINPMTLISDAMQSLSTHNDLNIYIQNLAILLGMAVVFFGISALTLGRKKYDNI